MPRARADVVVADNGQIALELALTAQGRGQPFDVILMPVLDGYDTVRKLRAEGYAAPIIALTAHAMTQDRLKCLDAGCDAYVTKPIERYDLFTAIAEFLERPAPVSG